jgi:hypothetical protein
MMTSLRFLVLAALLALFAGTPVHAKPKIAISEIKAGRIANLLAVTATEVRCAALGEGTGWLGLGHRPTYKKAHVSLFRLDAKGKPIGGVPTTFKLPALPAAFAKHPNYALSLAFHPKLPLLYVWQDIEFPVNTPALPVATVKDLDHLLIYSLVKATPELVLSLGRGPEFAYGKTAGDVAVEPAGKYLYVPNLGDAKDPAVVKVGRFDLDADGLPVWSDKTAPKGGTKAVRIAALNAAKAAAKLIWPQETTPYDASYTFANVAHGCGHNFVHLTKDVVLFASGYAVQTWEPSSRNAKVNAILFGSINQPYRVAAHPKLPALYVTAIGQNEAYRIFHAQGHFTLMPQTVTLKGVNLLSPPAVLGRANKVAFGGAKRIYVVSLDKKGSFVPEAIQVVVDNPQVEALVYSSKFDLLYVPVEVSK